jgi:hypothetical protein
MVSLQASPAATPDRSLYLPYIDNTTVLIQYLLLKNEGKFSDHGTAYPE